MSCDVGEVTESLENEQSSYVTGFSLTSPGELPMVHVEVDSHIGFETFVGKKLT